MRPSPTARHGLSAVLLIGLMLGVPAMAADGRVTPSQPREAPDEVVMVIEVPAGSFTKYERDEATGHLIVDRFLSMPVVYPANYGSIPATKAGDGDPLDVLVYTRQPVVPGALMRVRPIGILKMIDGGEQDDKIVAVPASRVDPTYDDVDDISDLPAIEQERLVGFFRVYKQAPAGGEPARLGGLQGADAAKAMIRDALLAYGSPSADKPPGRPRSR